MHPARRWLALIGVFAVLGLAPLVGHAQSAPPSAAPTPSPSASALPTASASSDCGFACSAIRVGSGIVGAVASAPGAAANAVVGGLANDATLAFTQWVGNGAAGLLASVANGLNSVTPDLTSSWWKSHYAAMATVGLAIMFPFAMLLIVLATIRRDPVMMLRGFFIQVPLAFLLTVAAVGITSSLLAITDNLTQYVAGPMQQDTAAFFTGLSRLFMNPLSAASVVPLFVVAITAIATVIAGLVLFLELLIRSAVIYLALLFLPLALAATVWPGARVWAKRLTETLGAAILAKFVIVAVLSLAAAALASIVKPGGTPTITSLGAGVVLLGLAAYAPYKLLRLIPLAEGAATNHLSGVRSGATQRTRHLASGIQSVVSRGPLTIAGARPGRVAMSAVPVAGTIAAAGMTATSGASQTISRTVTAASPASGKGASGPPAPGLRPATPTPPPSPPSTPTAARKPGP